MATKTPSHHQVILKHEKLMNTIWKQYVCTQTHQRPISSKFATPCCCNTMLKNCRMNKKLGDTQNNVNKKPFSPSSISIYEKLMYTLWKHYFEFKHIKKQFPWNLQHLEAAMRCQTTVEWRKDLGLNDSNTSNFKVCSILGTPLGDGGIVFFRLLCLLILGGGSDNEIEIWKIVTKNTRRGNNAWYECIPCVNWVMPLSLERSKLFVGVLFIAGEGCFVRSSTTGEPKERWVGLAEWPVSGRKSIFIDGVTLEQTKMTVML